MQPPEGQVLGKIEYRKANAFQRAWQETVVLTSSISLDKDVRLPAGHDSADWLRVAVMEFIRDLFCVLSLLPEHEDCHFMWLCLFRYPHVPVWG